MKHPITAIGCLEVFGFDPAPRFLWVSPFGPLPERLEDGMIYFGKGSATGAVLMVLGPSPNDGIENKDEFSGRRLRIGFDDLADFGEEGFHVLCGGFGAQTFTVAADVLSEKIESSFNVRDACLVR
jgi:hypothetical protein